VALAAVVVLVVAGRIFWAQRGRLLPSAVPRAMRPGVTAPAAPEVPADLGLQFKDIKIVQRSGGQIEWELQAASVEVSKDERVTVLTGVRRAVLYRAGKPQATLSADRVRLNAATKNLVAEGHVIIQGQEAAPADQPGVLLRTTRARWMDQEQKLVCPDPVQMQLGGRVFQAPKLYLLVRERRIVLPRVKVTGPEGTLTADHLTADPEAETLEVEGNVRMRVRLDEP
jgi:LPS export ABC transporter protein LptC